MPRTRWKLTAREQVEHVARAKQLHAMGVDIKVPKFHSPIPGVDFDIGYAPNFCNSIFNASPSLIAVVIGARIVSRRTGIYLNENIYGRLPWEGDELELWYTDGVGSRPYHVSPGLTLEWKDVLNHQLEAGIRLQRGKPLTGALILVAYDAQIPKKYQQGDVIDIRLVLTDSLGTEFPADGKVRVDRRLGVTLRPTNGASSLFDGEYRPTVVERSRAAYVAMKLEEAERSRVPSGPETNRKDWLTLWRSRMRDAT